MKFKHIAILIAMFMVFPIVGCGTITISSEGTRKISSTPTYQQSKHFFLWGIVGEHEVNVRDVCDGDPAKQMQTQDTFLDGFLTFITLGIYQPRTVKVWCQ